jgi:NADP-dependent 3-hydroxy acid dehydrogenase YdfG
VGYETAKNLIPSSSTHHVLLGSRDPSKGSEAVSTIEALLIKGTVKSIQIDVTDDASVDAAARHVGEVLIWY